MFAIFVICNSDNTCYVNYQNKPSRGLTRFHEHISAAQNEVLHRESSQRRVRARIKRLFLLAFSTLGICGQIEGILIQAHGSAAFDSRAQSQSLQ